LCLLFQSPESAYGRSNVLVFNRWPGDQIVLSHGITLTVVEIRGGWVQLAIDDPEQAHLLRAELACRHGGPPDAEMDDRAGPSTAAASGLELQQARR
jgi:hypothetical protein